MRLSTALVQLPWSQPSYSKFASRPGKMGVLIVRVLEKLSCLKVRAVLTQQVQPNAVGTFRSKATLASQISQQEDLPG
jgi:hypothetical protein